MEFEIQGKDKKYFASYDSYTDETMFDYFEGEYLEPIEDWEDKARELKITTSFRDYVDNHGLNECIRDYAPNGSWSSHSTEEYIMTFKEYLEDAESDFREFAIDIMTRLGWL